MKTFRKALSIILGLAMILSCVAGMQISASAEGNLTLSVGEATINEDGTVIVPVIATGSIHAFTATVAYDDALTLVDAVKVPVANVEDKAVLGPTDADPFKMQFAFALEQEDVALDKATIANLTFKVADANAETANINLEVTEAWDAAGNAVAATAVDGTVEFVKECAHEWGTGVVTTQPTKDAEGVMTYTCSKCSETKTEAIAKPVATTAVTFKGDIVCASVVGSNFTISTKQMRTAYGDDASYFIVVDYQKFGSGDNLYMIENQSVVYDDSDKIVADSTANKSIIRFAEGALSEMTLDFTATAYFVNGDGVVVGYRTFTTNIANMALSYAPTAGADLLTALADMCAYGDAVIEHFAGQNPGTDICDVILPSEIFGDYMSNKSDASDLPAAGSYNNDKASTKIVSTTGFISAGQTLVVGASNQISYTLRYDNYNWEDVRIVVSYEDSINGLQEFTLTSDDLIPNGTAGNGQPKFTYYFKDLSIYDVDKTVTMNMYYKDTLELTSIYSIGNFVNANLNGNLSEALITMELFSNSAGVALQLPARW